MSVQGAVEKAFDHYDAPPWMTELALSLAVLVDDTGRSAVARVSAAKELRELMISLAGEEQVADALDDLEARRQKRRAS